MLWPSTLVLVQEIPFGGSRSVPGALSSERYGEHRAKVPRGRLNKISIFNKSGRVNILRRDNQEQITSWFLNLEKSGSDESREVCAIKFIDNSDKKYKLKTFKNADEARKSGWLITHKYKCGTCSSLKDLAVYMAKSDLTDPVRFCTKKPTLKN